MAAGTMQGDPRALIHRRALTASGTLPTQVLGDKLPVHQIPPRRDILWPGIAVVYVVRMLPHIAGQQRGFAITQRTAGICGGFDAHIPRRIFHQPGPAGAKLSSSSSTKGVFEGLKIAPATVDGGRYVAGRLTAATRRHGIPVKGVIPHLRRIVEQPTCRRRADELFQTLVRFRFALREIIQVRDISLVMPAVVKIERFGRNMGLQGIFSIWEWW